MLATLMVAGWASSLLQKVGERIDGIAILPDDDGRDSLANGALGCGIVEDLAVGVAVHVDEAWRQARVRARR